MAREKWNQPKNAPECLVNHLETFVWEGYEGKCREEKEVARYILRNASRLKKVAFSKPNSNNSKERLEMLEELASLVRSSNSSCQFKFE